jgi:hypothetical protein
VVGTAKREWLLGCGITGKLTYLSFIPLHSSPTRSSPHLHFESLRNVDGTAYRQIPFTLSPSAPHTRLGLSNPSTFSDLISSPETPPTPRSPSLVIPLDELGSNPPAPAHHSGTTVQPDSARSLDHTGNPTATATLTSVTDSSAAEPISRSDRIYREALARLERANLQDQMLSSFKRE